METIKNGIFAHGYKLSKHRFQIVQTLTKIELFSGTPLTFVYFFQHDKESITKSRISLGSPAQVSIESRYNISQDKPASAVLDIVTSLVI